MKLNSLSFSAVAYITVTWEDLEILSACSMSHSDPRCKSMSDPSVINSSPFAERGLLHRMAFQMSWTRTPHKVTWSELDTMAKTLEIGSYFPDREKAKQAVALGVTLRQVMGEIASKLPKEIEPEPPFPVI